MCRGMQRLCCVTLSILAVLAGARPDNRYEQTDTSIYYTEPTTLINATRMVSNNWNNGGLHELHGGHIIRGQRLLSRSKSPYLLREDLFVEKDGELVIESGVEIRFGPMIGITVRGIITAKGEPHAPILLSAAEVETQVPTLRTSSTIRLVDGPSPLVGRLQLFHQGAWRSVCTNSRNWTRADLETACRQLGYQGGQWWSWIDRQWPANPRLLYEEPGCRGTEPSLTTCERWSERELGAGVCDYHPDLGISCLPRHDGATKATKHWRGIRFEDAIYYKALIQQNTLYVRRSRSTLRNTVIEYAGTGREYNITSAIHVEGVPPRMESISVLHSALTGINVTTSDASVVINNCTVQYNRGYGIYINSSAGMAYINNCTVLENGADGIKYVHADERPDDKLDRNDVYDLCTFPTTASQTFPVTISMEQNKYAPNVKRCPQHIFTRPGHVLTVHFLQMKTDRNDSAVIKVYDGLSGADRLLASVKVRNGTLPQSVTSTHQNLFVKFIAESRTNTIVFVRVSSGYKKTYDLNVTGSVITGNNGRGIIVEKLRSALHIHETSVSNNDHVAGVHVLGGAMDVNITDSRISFNQGDGVNITVTGGNRNVSRSSISSNNGYGFAVWLNDSLATEYIHFNQSTVVEYSQIFRNKDIGVLIGNSTGNSYVNITGNWFNTSLETALQVESSWRMDNGLMKVQIGHNSFIRNAKLGIKLSPALNLDAIIEYNHFREQATGAILIKNPLYEEFNILPAEIVIRHNEFYNNRGTFVVSIGLSPYNDAQKLLFTRNFLRENRVRELFDNGNMRNVKLIPRSRVAAVVVVSSSNVEVFRNILHNPESPYEIGSHLEDQSKVINCTYNWLGSGEEKWIFDRLFHRKDRYNLAKIEYLPYLLHSSNPGANTIIPNPTFVPQFVTPGTNLVGGEVDGQEELKAGEYIVERDINVRPGGKLILQPGVTLRFPPAVGMMVAGKFDAHGKKPSDILFTLKEELALLPNNDTFADEDTIQVDETESVPVRLLGGKTNLEGRLQVKIGNKWGTVCNYGWTILDAALVCHQLGFILDFENWFMERSQIPNAGINEDILLSNVRCNEYDSDITKCRAEKEQDFENSCTHANDVGVRCLEVAWAGLRLGPLAQRSDLQYVTIERAGLLDYKTNSFKPALQIDFARHSLDGVKVFNNLHDGLGVLYSDIYSADAINTVTNSDFFQNGGSGISFKQLGMRIINSRIEGNKVAGIRHNPALSAVQQREFAGWFLRAPDTTVDSPYNPTILPEMNENIEVANGETKYIITTKVTGESVHRTINIKCTPGYVIGIQLLNPIENRSTEQIILHDSQRFNKNQTIWHVKRDLSIFPVSSSSFVMILEYSSGENAIGGTVIAITSLLAPIQNIRNRIVSGPIPSLILTKTRIKRNQKGVFASYYNRYLNEIGDHFLRKANETIQLIGCEISHNYEEAIYVYSPHWNIFQSNLSEISIHINNSLITDNGKGIYQFSRDARHSNNLFHWIMQDSTIERNHGGGFEVLLPDVWQYNENFTHSLYFGNNTWRNNEQFSFIVDGHFAHLNISYNRFDSNRCKTGLISVRGMEKRITIDNNRIEGNSGAYMVEFRADSQSEILGVVYARFYYNEIKRNAYDLIGMGPRRTFDDPSYVVGFHGIQKVRINRNLFGENSLDYELLAGIRTAKTNNEVDVTENWWGTANDTSIRSRIFDFDDWNDHAVANYRPYLISDSFDASISASWHISREIDLDNLGGRIVDNLSLHARPEPYIVRSDITVMPEATLHIYPDVVMEFAPNVGILVLGTLKAIGVPGHEIIMRPMKRVDTNSSFSKLTTTKTHANLISMPDETIRMCKNGRCSALYNEGFLEYFNRTTLQWIPLCDDRFTERNAQVACRQLGYDTLNVYVSYDRRYELHPGSLTRVWSWPEPLQCSGKEQNLEDCQIRLNGQLFGHRHECPWDGQFVFLHCGKRNLDDAYDYWGGIRIANSEFEHHLYEHRIHDVVTHETVRRVESVLKFINITGAGILHYEKSSAIQSIMKSPAMVHVNIDRSAYHGINVVSPTHTVELLFNTIDNVLGNGVNILSLTGEGREADESSFTPIKDLNIPYHLFSMVDICDTAKEITIEERVIVYYKYDNYPVNCVKIFRSPYRAKPFGFRLLQFNLYNSTGKPGRHDSITLYDGDIYNITTKKIGHLEVNTLDEKKLFRTQNPSISIRLFANGASNVHGFIAEIVTLPISAIGFNRDVQHNVSYSVISNCREGAIKYASAGEVNAIMTLERNQFINNCEKLYGNFTTCKSALWLDVQNTQSLYFRNNLIQRNQGGLSVRADSRGSATSLKGWIHNNLFTENFNKPALYVEGRQSSPYQEVTIFRNYFTKNNAPYDNNIVLKQVVSNMTLNYLHGNLGMHLLEISGFEKVRLPIYQSTSHNGFYKNYAVDREGRSTIIAGTPGQQYVDNVFFNPDNDYEMLTTNRSQQLEMWRSHVDARHNWWGYNETLAVAGRVRDRGDSPELLQVDYQPFHMNNKSVLSGKCPPAWDLVGDTCYILIGAPMDFYSARDFCRSANASMPFIMRDYLELWKFARKQQERFDYSERVWVQQLERVDQCTAFTYQTIEIDYCAQPNPFICEIDPRVNIDPLSWRKDIVAVGVLGAVGVALALLTAAIALWASKSKKRKLERLERRNSIRQSLHSLRSVGSTSGFTELAYRRKPITTKHSTDTLNSNYKRMLNGGSLDSMDKSQLNSSIEDNQSYDVYEAHNPRYSPSTSDFKSTVQKYGTAQSVDNPIFDLAYRNEGFRNHSTFAARNGIAAAATVAAATTASNWPSQPNVQSTSVGESPPNNESSYFNNASTLPLHSSLALTDSINELKRDIESSSAAYDPVDYDSRRAYDTATLTPSQASEPVPEYAPDFQPPVPPHPYHYEIESRPRSEALLETNFDTGEEKPLRSKSEVLLETNLDAFLVNEPTELTQLSATARSKSQPLETAM
ncbi:protein bark beetle [Monomorium pharaonis]|uniref:protein bark beetle n=1 Tax=Monomorium pharaonis TaxID=307658 RepID=UPI00063FC92B|nr:protein bark beetle [Monomorium pharaonis]XP_012531770.1 protein bark beetle [Monomorium pharaonis]XP_012531771.1 protein bark beetle [Monomorium pharaonis]XP_036147493.1 protein bark beetle [Monomorium pharaonis]XP_036147494.1 protein bark beetle [Monomorium pharaonis]XP_036147495.1 protein bark beetle [Monomorium pharaonis]XP_036147496.1 protein bark beetle [Monomorium pharaonis]XP_036147498.1 protein bark beetle [Monomorium pharaonis]